MATVSTKLMTAQEFYEWANSPENCDRYFELERGEVIELPPPGKRHGFVCANVGRILGNFAAKRGKGYVCTNDSGVVVEQDPDTVRGPDLTFYEDTQSIADMETRYSFVPPVLAVEVMSPNDRINKTVRRVKEMLRMGVKQVWVIDPESRDVGIYRLGRDAELLGCEEQINADEILPGFHCLVGDLFAIPGAS